MRNLRNTKEDFVKGVMERFDSGKWGLKELEYLNDNHTRYHLTYEDIGNFVLHLYQYVYTMAMEDGVITELEQDQLIEIRNLAIAPAPKNRFEIDRLKVKALTLINRIEKANALQENVVLENDLAQDLAVKQEKEMIQEEVKRVYYRNYPTPYPKLTPYTY